jgi:hypothetical protein
VSRHGSHTIRQTNKPLFFAAVFLLATAAAQAQVAVDKPWARTTVAQQTTSAAYMTITSANGARELRDQDSAFIACLMPSLTPTSLGRPLIAIAASFSL